MSRVNVRRSHIIPAIVLAAILRTAFLAGELAGAAEADPRNTSIELKMDQFDDASKVVMDGSDSDAVLCVDIAGLRTRPYVKQATAHLGGLDAQLGGDDRFIQLASHMYQNSNGRRHLLMGVERTSGAGPLLVECGYLRDRDGSPSVQVLWDGTLLGTLES